MLGLGFYPIAFFFLALIAGPLLIIYPKFGLWVAIIGALVAAGLVELYLPSLNPIKWVLSLLSIGLALVAIFISFFRKASVRTKNNDNQALILWMFGFFICTLFSSIVNWHGIAAVVVGLKGYFQIWGLLITIYYLIDNKKDSSRLIQFLLLLGLIQLPFILHQFLFLVPLRIGLTAAQHNENVVAIDVVAGTFGATMFGGGRSSSVALLSVICITIMLARWRTGFASLGRVLLLCSLFLFPLLLNESKIVVVLLPVAVFLLFRDRILTNPFKALAGLSVMAALVLTFFSLYLMLPGAESQRKQSIEAMFNETVDYNFGRHGYGSAILNRTTVYSFWAEEHFHGDMIATLLIGHGPGATNRGSAIVTDSLTMQSYAGYGIGLTGLSSLLWEVGLVGATAVLAMLFSFYRLGGRLAETWNGTMQWPLIKASQVSMALFFINLLHNNYFVFDLGFQALLVLIMGYLLVMTRIKRTSE
jgi:hypothetical protein